MKYITPRLITALRRSAITKTTRKKNKQNEQKHVFLANVLKEEKKTQILTTPKTFIEMHIGQQTKHQLRHDIIGKMFFALQ